MKLVLIAVGKKMPEWVNSAFAEYNKRLPKEFHLDLTEIAPASRSKTVSTEKIITEETDRIRAAIPDKSYIVALDESGNQLTSRLLAKQMEQWSLDGLDVTFVIGGADGLGDDLLQEADMRWSLSELTLPHALVRVVLVEQVYRAWSILKNHPYHRK